MKKAWSGVPAYSEQLIEQISLVESLVPDISKWCATGAPPIDAAMRGFGTFMSFIQ